MATSFTLAPFGSGSQTARPAAASAAAPTYQHPHSHAFVPRPPSQPSPSGTLQSPPYSLRLPAHPSASSAAAASSSHAAAAASSDVTVASPSSLLSTGFSMPAASPSDPSASGQHARFYYKLVARVGPGRYVSIYDGQTEYVMGRTIRCEIKPAANGGWGGMSSGASTARSAGGRTARSTLSHGSNWSATAEEMRGGLFVCRTPEEALAARLPDVSALAVAPRALIKVMGWGDSYSVGRHTLAFSCLRPVQAYPTLSLGYRCAWVAPRTLTAITLNETRKRLPPFHAPTHTSAPGYREREERSELNRSIMSMERKITQDTRAQLGW